MPDPPGGYRYYRDPELGPELRAGDGRAVRDLRAGAAARRAPGPPSEFPRAADEAPAAHARAIKAKALDLLRGLLPASSLSHMGIFATGQTYEQLILHLLAHPLPEARSYGRMILDEVKAVMPSFVARVERPDRGGEWIGYLEAARGAGRALGAAARAARGRRRRRPRPVGRADCRSTATRTTCWRRCCSSRARSPRTRSATRSRALDADERGRAARRPRRRARQPPPPPRPRLRGAALPLRDRLRLRRLPRPPAPPDADASSGRR